MIYAPGMVAVLVVGVIAADNGTTGASTLLGLVLGFVIVTLLIRRRERR